MVTKNVKELAFLVHLWFGLSVVDVPQDARWLFPEFGDIDNTSFIEKMIDKSKTMNSRLDLKSMVYPIERPDVPVTFKQLTKEYSDLIMFDSKECTSCHLGKMSLLCLVCQQWYCMNPSCNLSGLICP
jgi:hypothetical protein